METFPIFQAIVNSHLILYFSFRFQTFSSKIIRSLEFRRTHYFKSVSKTTHTQHSVLYMESQKFFFFGFGHIVSRIRTTYSHMHHIAEN